MAVRDAGPPMRRPVAERDVRAALLRILTDREFRGSERHRKMLLYLVDEYFAGRSGQVKAYTIAVDVLGRPSSFDPVKDPIVRVEVARLRAALARYYETVGQNIRLRIDLPPGNYTPHFLISDPASCSSETSASPKLTVGEAEEPLGVQVLTVPKPRSFGRLAVAIAATAAIAAISASFLFAAGRLPGRQTVLSAKPTVIIDFAATKGPDGEEQENAGEYLAHALSQFSSLRPLTPASAAGASPSSDEYRLSTSFSVRAREYQLIWQVVDAQTNEAVRSGIAKAPIDNGDVRSIQQSLLDRLARSLAGEDGVIVSLAAARQLASPSIGFGCVLLAKAALARTDTEALAAAQTCLEQSLVYQPANPDILASLARVLLANGGASSSPEMAARALDLANKAVALGPQSAESYLAQMQARFFAGEEQAAFLSGRRAMLLNPLDDAIPARLGLLLFISGRYGEGLRFAHRANTSNSYPHRDAALTFALEAYRNGNYSEALSLARQLANPADIDVNLLRVAAAAQLSLREATSTELTRLHPNGREATTSIESGLTARGYAPEMVALLKNGLGKAALTTALREWW